MSEKPISYPMQVFIKNMTDPDRRRLVCSILQQLNIQAVLQNDGELYIPHPISIHKYQQFTTRLFRENFQLVDEKHAIQVEKIKLLLIQQIHYTEETLPVNYSTYLSDAFQLNYCNLSKFFSRYTSTTIEHFIICEKIQRVKHLMIDGGLKISEIARRMHYSSVSHLSHQFKKITGMTPSAFRDSFTDTFSTGKNYTTVLP